MGKITFVHKGDWSKTTKFLDRCKLITIESILEKYGEMGVQALSDATPIRTGLASSSWYYKIVKNDGGAEIQWCNSDMEPGPYGVNVAVIIQYGHATKNGGWVEGIDYVNPAIRPIFDKIADHAWKEVSEL